MKITCLVGAGSHDFQKVYMLAASRAAPQEPWQTIRSGEISRREVKATVAGIRQV